jgi:LysM repeat protein
MRSSREGRRRHPTAIALVVLIVVVALAVLGLVALGGGGGGGRRADSRRAATTTAPTLEPASRPGPTTTGPPIVYTVQRGDTLTSIGQKYSVTPKAILAINQIPNPDNLTEGEHLMVPRAPPLRLVVSPVRTTAGESVRLRLTGAKPSESVTFAITSPTGTFTGPAHVASDEGSVSTKYEPALADPAGIYTVVAHGSQGTTAQAKFQVKPA